MNQLTKEDAIALLKEGYMDGWKLIEYTRKVRGDNNDFLGKYTIKQADLDGLFSVSVWKELPTKSGHRKLKNRISGIIVGYSDHSKQIDPGAVETILETVQEHINFLGNEIFEFGRGDWNDAPDYQKAADLWLKLKNQNAL